MACLGVRTSTFEDIPGKFFAFQVKRALARSLAAPYVVADRRTAVLKHGPPT